MKEEININHRRRAFLKNSINIAIAAGVAAVIRPSISYAMRKSGYIPLFTSNNPGYNGYMYYEGLSNYLLGPGRVYSPKVFQFLSTDRLAPFGDAGVNRYANIDPINIIDPTGYLGWQAWLGIGLGIATLLFGGVALISAFAGIASVLSGSIVGLGVAKVAIATVSAVYGITSGTLAIASGAISETNPSISDDLGLAATVFGVSATITAWYGWKVGGMIVKKGLYVNSTTTPAPNFIAPVRGAMAATKHNAWWTARIFGLGRSIYSTKIQIEKRGLLY